MRECSEEDEGRGRLSRGCVKVWRCESLDIVWVLARLDTVQGGGGGKFYIQPD